MHDEFLRAIGQTCYGWLTPDLEPVACSQYGHLQLIGERVPQYRAWTDLVAALDAQIEADKTAFYDESSPDFKEDLDLGGGWHNFESDAQNEAAIQRNHLMVRLHQDGWLRIGLSRMRTFSGHRTLLEFDGAPGVLRAQETLCHELAAALGAEPVMTPTRYCTYGQVEVTAQTMLALRPRWATRVLEKTGSQDATWLAHWQCRTDQVPEDRVRARVPLLATWFASVSIGTQHLGMDTDEANGKRTPLPAEVVDAAVKAFRPDLPQPGDIPAALERGRVQRVDHEAGLART